MIQQYVGGNLVPFLYTSMTYQEALESSPQLDTYYLIKAVQTSALPEAFTGRVMGDIIFINGYAKVRTLYDKRLLLMRGCIDVTPEWMLTLLKNRTLDRILIIRNAAFGDVTILTPAFQAMRDKYPEATIHFYGREDSRDVMMFNPYVDAIIDVRTTEIGQIKHMYDEIFDLVHSIECNPSADFKAALDVAHDLLLLDPPSKARNTYRITSQEKEDAGRSLYELGIAPNDPNIIIFQYEGTALARSLSPILVFQVSNYLAEQGYTVLLWSHKPDILGYGFYVCNETNRMCSIPKVEPKDGKILLKNREGKETEHTEVSWAAGVKMVLKKNDGTAMTYKNRRSKFAICSYAKHIISVDSFISHLADALSVTSTIIFTNYHPYTRTKYYELADVVHVDYDKELPCGPCNGLLNDCPFNRGSLPPCSTKIKSKDVIEKVMMRLHGLNNLYEEYRDEGVLPDNYEQEECSCSVCKSKNTRLITVKGRIPFHKCLDCSSIFANRKPANKDQQFIHESYFQHRDLSIVDLAKRLTGDQNIEMISDIVEFEDPKGYAFKDLKEVSRYDMNKNEKLERVSMFLDTFSSFSTPEEAIEFLDTRTELGHKILVTITQAETWDHSNTWFPMLTSIAGLNQVIYSFASMVKLFNKDSGKYADRYRIIKAMEITPQKTMYCLERIG